MGDASRQKRSARRAAYLSARADAQRRLEGGELDQVVELLDSPWPGVRLMVVRALRKDGRREAVPQLIDHASTEMDESVRGSIVLALADLPDERSRAPLRRLLDDKSEEVRRLALRGLSRLGDERVIPVARAWYESGGYTLRAEAVGALANLHTEAGSQAVQELQATERNWLRRHFIRKVLRSASHSDGKP